MPTIEAFVEVWCGTCGAGLCSTVSTNGNSITVPVCDYCLDKAKSDGYDEGYSDGYRNCQKSYEED